MENMNSNLLTNAERAAHILKMVSPDVVKGGEGSKGGKVIGHTKSGKPIYENKFAHEYKDFDYHDHSDAERVHQQVHLAMSKKGSSHFEAKEKLAKKSKDADLKEYHHLSNKLYHQDKTEMEELLKDPKKLKQTAQHVITSKKLTPEQKTEKLKNHYQQRIKHGNTWEQAKKLVTEEGKEKGKKAAAENKGRWNWADYED